MKALTIIRHAKAELPEEYANDFDRPLTPRGRKDASHMAKLLAQLDPPVDWLISSPAVRTQQTAERIIEKLHLDDNIAWQEAIYEADAESLMKVLSEAPQDMEHVVLVGHNPGMEELVAGLCTGAPPHLNLTMTPGALAHLHLEIFWWNQIRWGCGKLQLLVPPKLIRK